MALIAEVFVNLPARRLNHSFTYLVPDELGQIGPGWRVLVPFGGRKAEGFVVSVGEADAAADAELKSIMDAIDDGPWFTDQMLAVAAWISEYYLCTPAEAMRLFVPGKAGIKSATVYRATGLAAEEFLTGRPPLAGKVYAAVSAGPRTLAQLTGEFDSGAAAVLRLLVRHGLVAAKATARRTARTQYRTYWRLAVDEAAATSFLANLKGRQAQGRLLAALLADGRLGPEDLKRLKVAATTTKSLEAAGLVAAEREAVVRDSYAGAATGALIPAPTEEQRAVLAALLPAVQAKRFESFLLHGVTGSGKTQVYIEAAAAARAAGRQVVVLVPEIALTGQIVTRFKARFGDDVVVAHSKLSVGERYDAWQRLRSGTAGIVIGARSAVFAPVPDPGLFVIDEEQEFTYKQEESPRYHTREVALKRAALAGAAVVLGSATPAVETYHDACAGRHRLLAMPSRVDGSPLPVVQVVDMREELKAGRRSVISAPLRELLTETVDRREQAILFLNRRGYATFVLCRDCGEVMRCGRCAVSLVYHAAGNVLRCHYCQACQPAPDVCPACGSRYIRYFGTGTQKVEEELAALLPAARVVRMDQDTTGGKMAHDRILSAFAAGRYDILLGTQMVAKGHDIKQVTAVGVISADTSLYLPDFRAAERTFMLLTQAAGRAGRGGAPGRVVVQTYSPEHYAVQAGARHDYAAFYEEELACRRELGYPPFASLVKLTVQGEDEVKARRQAEETAAALRARLPDKTMVVGPFAAPIARISDIYRLHILIKTTDTAAARAAFKALGLEKRSDIAIDVDPVNVM
ncbi:primosomal protein N' [Anaeroselena agilis]|uniref:Replication restart protein PriA n=1 Tax=Anaeroselena agilis TaxID=3063788 RepID=A0ABU3NYK9_9FIRM|nr:primosomal protein N' [Selenomonadales bacterium 4137-cl]